MSGALAKLDETVAKLEAAAERARANTREANEAAKALREAVREGRALVKEIEAAADRAVEDRLRPVVKEGLDQVLELVNKSLTDAVVVTMAKFDSATAPILETLGMLDLAVAAKRRSGEAKCPGCGEALTGAAALVGDDLEFNPLPPEAGNLNICAHCGLLSEFTGSGFAVRPLPPARLAEALRDPAVAKAVDAARALGRDS